MLTVAEIAPMNVLNLLTAIVQDYRKAINNGVSQRPSFTQITGLA